MEKQLVADLYKVWSQDDLSQLGSLVSENYTIFSDPGDGKTLKLEEYHTRLMYSRKAFPDLFFEISHLISEEQLVDVVWKATGTHRGDLPGLPATGKKLTFAGQTMYLIKNKKFAGHWQTIDRLDFIQQFKV
jgi:steroid delta-isomerase-like uncharacterized protein